jgi:hypothetical protein
LNRAQGQWPPDEGEGSYAEAGGDSFRAEGAIAADTFVFISCAPHGRVGTSTTARLLSDYYLATRRSFSGFDADPHEPEYAPRFGERVTGVDLANVQGQIAMIDRLLVPDREPKIVDLWSRSFSKFFGLAQEIGFFDEARDKGVAPVILFHADASEASAAAAYKLAATFPGVETLLVHNEGAAPLGEAANERLAQYPPHRRLKIRALDAAMRRALEPSDLSLSWLLVDPPRDMSLVVRSGLRAWLQPVFSQFRSFELRHSFDGANFLS